MGAMNSRIVWVTDQKIKTKQKKTHIASRNEPGRSETNMKGRERRGGREKGRKSGEEQES